MDRWNFVLVRAYDPAAFALLVAGASMAVFSQWQASPLLAGFMGGRALGAAAGAGSHVLAVWLRLRTGWCSGSGVTGSFACVAAARWGTNARGATPATAALTGAATHAATT